MPFHIGKIDLLFLICACTGTLFITAKIIILLSKIKFTGEKTANENLVFLIVNLNFRLFSMNILAVFIVIFGLMGIALYRYSNVDAMYSMAGGIAAGIVSALFIVKFLNVIKQLQLNQPSTRER